MDKIEYFDLIERLSFNLQWLHDCNKNNIINIKSDLSDIRKDCIRLSEVLKI